MRVRPARPTDAAPIAGLVAEMGYRSDAAAVRAQLEELPESHAVLVAEVDDVVVGWVHVLIGRPGRGAGLGQAARPAGRLPAFGSRTAGRAPFYRSLGYIELKTQLAFTRTL